MSEDSDYTSDVSYPNQLNQYSSYHQANSSSSQFESVARQMNPSANVPDQYNHQITSNNDVLSNVCQENKVEPYRPKRELPFGGSTDIRNFKKNQKFQKSSTPQQNMQMNNTTQINFKEEQDSLFYNSRPRRALPQIHFNKEGYAFMTHSLA